MRPVRNSERNSERWKQERDIGDRDVKTDDERGLEQRRNGEGENERQT